MVKAGLRKKVVVVHVKGLTSYLNEWYEGTCLDSQYPDL